MPLPPLIRFAGFLIGNTVSALFETGTRDSYRFGTTPNFTRVAVTGAGDLQNQILPVIITAAADRFTFGHLTSPQQTHATVAVL